MNTGGLFKTITLKVDVAYIAPSNKVTVIGKVPVASVIRGAIEKVEPVRVMKVFMGKYDTVTGKPSGSVTVKKYESVAPLNTD